MFTLERVPCTFCFMQFYQLNGRLHMCGVNIASLGFIEENCLHTLGFEVPYAIHHQKLEAIWKL